MRTFCVISCALIACGQHAPPAVAPPADCKPLHAPQTPSNGTSLATEPMTTPVSNMNVQFISPELG